MNCVTASCRKCGRFTLCNVNRQSKEITKFIKDYNKKIQTSFQNQMIRVTAKKRDELQNVITLLKESNIKTPLSYINFRD